MKKKTNFDFLLQLEALKILDKLSNEILNRIPIDLSIVRDRIGNILFQYPVNLLDVHANALKGWDGVHLRFEWNPAIVQIPDCIIQVESTFDKNLMGAKLEEYTQGNLQDIKIDNLDQINSIRIWKKKTSLHLEQNN